MTRPLEYGMWAALLVPLFVGLAVAVSWLVDQLRRPERQETTL